MTARSAALVAPVIVVASAAALLAMGRLPWCTCGQIRLWTSDAWGSENSQQIADPYVFTHVSHGVLFYALLWLAAGRRLSLPARFVLAIGVEASWEVLENTPMAIERYRTATMALGYYGDTVINSIADVFACGAGFLLAAYLPTRATAVLVVALEIALALWIRDGLLLNVVMLIHPIEAVKTWQASVVH